MTEEQNNGEKPVIRNKRKIDPLTSQPIDNASSQDSSRFSVPASSDAGTDGEVLGESHEKPSEDTVAEARGDEVDSDAQAREEGKQNLESGETLSDADLSFLSGQSSAEQLAAGLVDDLKRVTAEYANYRKRTESSREVERERALGDAIRVLLPVLDDLDRAEKHGDLDGDAPFATIAQKLRASVEKLGLRGFGKVGDVFDPSLHEAVFHTSSETVEHETVTDVVETGYQVGSTMIRVAKVVVTSPV